SRRRHTRFSRDWSSDVCSSDLSDSIYISNNITVDNLHPVSSFLGKLGNPERGGLGLAEFKRRQALHREAEIAAMKDVPEFIRKRSEERRVGKESVSRRAVEE